MQHGRDDPCCAVGGRGDHTAAVGVFFVDRQRVQIDPVEHRQRIAQRGFRVFTQLAMQRRRTPFDLQATRQNAFVAATRFDAVLHDLPDVQQALTGFRFGAPRGFVRQHDLADGETAGAAMQHQIPCSFEGIHQRCLIFHDAIRASRILIHHEAAANGVVLAAADLYARGVEGTENHAVGVVGQGLANHRQVMLFDEFDAVLAEQVQAFTAAYLLQASINGFGVDGVRVLTFKAQ